MSPSEIPQPLITSGRGYGWLYALYLHIGAGILRTVVWLMTSTGKDFDRVVTIQTPGLGPGKVRCALSFPASPDPSDQPSENLGRFPLVIVLEGGGFVLGQPEDGERNDRLVATKEEETSPDKTLIRTRSVVLSVDYAKSPRYPFPHALLQIYEVVRWATSSEGQAVMGVSIDPSRVAFMGNSAGGNLTASLSLLLSFRSGPCARFSEALPPTFRQLLQILLYPSVECHHSYQTRYQRCTMDVQAKSLPIAVAELMEASYLPPSVAKEQIFVAPLLANPALLNQLQVPAALILTAGMDCLKDEAELYARNLEMAGVCVKIKQYPFAIHGFSHYTEGHKGFRAVDVADCWKEVCDALNNVFHPASVL
ncbi:predicted protein [Aspergillus terreus NIH2624]|uniref:Alpha/beta hydrolase fold-3 domain-containing protein n=1 Tax=Aspergillus terreus (strain NIH 2624 / FGSC A1156) TaxID=341663 RepID=Q0C7Q8_ASPTN|nr:uncharacterized protein ATEG_10276 [Aspergillus terreus NIH2624]EAU29273.1 predicted protein [Aspergillus terreus NIH2624]